MSDPVSDRAFDQDPFRGKQNPARGKQDPVRGKQDPVRGKQDPARGTQDPLRGTSEPDADAAADVPFGASVASIAPIDRLLAVMARLREPEHGCEWDVAQTWATIAPYTIEEAYEVADAIERGDVDDVRDELGDLLLQVVFQSRIAEDDGLFTFDDVTTGIADKMERRHPHIFGDGGERVGWEEIKARERSGKAAATGALAGVALGLPALQRAEKLQRRAARVGFDWPDAGGPRAKVDEEIAEIDAASADTLAEEVGDLLFSVVNWARHLGVDAEQALRAANAKFERRFAGMEAAAGDGFAALDLDAKEALWRAVKVSDAGVPPPPRSEKKRDPGSGPG
jgi:ATP diphosphatase